MRHAKLISILALKDIKHGDMASIMGMRNSLFSRKVNGHIRFTLEEGMRLSSLLQVSMDDIFLPNSFPNGNTSENSAQENRPEESAKKG